MEISPNSKSMYERIEEVNKRVNTAMLPSIVNVLGYRCHLHKFIPDNTSDVYGTYSSAELSDTPIDIKLLMPGGMWHAICNSDQGWLEDQSYVYSTYNVEDNDVVSIKRSDNSKAQFKVTQTESIGHTTNLIKRFKLANLGD